MRTTITLNDKVFKALKLRALTSEESMSKLVEDAVKYQLLEDSEDIEDALVRSNERILSFDALVKEFQAEGLLPN